MRLPSRRRCIALAVTSRERNPAFLGADDFAKCLTAETPRWAAVVKASGTRLD